jgi:hypothetical protein
MLKKPMPRWLIEAGAQTHDWLVVLCVAGILAAVALLLFGNLGGVSVPGELP